MMSKEHDGTNERYKLKYMSLKKRLEEMQQTNERMLYRIHQVRRITSKLQRYRAALIKRLDYYSDDYREAASEFALRMCREDLVEQDSEVGVDDATVHLMSGSHVTAVLLSEAQDDPQKLAKKKPKKMSKENAPKKPSNAYLMFCQTQRATVQCTWIKDHPNKEEVNHQELTKELAERWNKLTPEEKQIYYKMYEKDKERYKKEVQELQKKEQDDFLVSHQLDNLVKQEADVTQQAKDSTTEGPSWQA